MESARRRRALKKFIIGLNWKKWAFPFIGLVSLAWFLIRVIPKPSRAAYPCQQAAFPIASGFVLWLVGISTSFAFFRHAHQRLHQARYAVALLGFATAAIVLGVTYVSSPAEQAMAADEAPFIPIDAPNQPMGEGRGIHPGRVVWSHNPDATSWDGKSNYWWTDENTDPIIIGEMFSQSLRALTATATDARAWDKLFKHFNAERGKGSVGYQSGEKIAIKLNLNQGSYRAGNQHYPAPQLVLAFARQLVNEAGVADADIAFYDATRAVPGSIYDAVKAEFPNSRFVDFEGKNGREKFVRDTAVQVHWSEELTLEPGGGNPTFLPTVLTEADHFINVGTLKGHDLAGVTICAKNNFGSLNADRSDLNLVNYKNAPKAAGIHPYIAVHDFNIGSAEWESFMRDMGSYNALVDLMGHEHLGGKTLLFIADALYPKRRQNYDKNDTFKWEMAPFNGDWASSIFLSQDEVAIESVGLDFLRTEPTQFNVNGNVDNYLHEASMAHDPPSGHVYAPNGDGVQLTSLGTHEHWNNAIDKQYSRNLGENYGIELVTPDMVTAVEEESAQALPRSLALRNYPNPFNASTVLSFQLPTDGQVRLEIYNSLGQRIALLLDDHLASGSYEFKWNGRNLQGRDSSSGVYFARLTTAGGLTTRKILLAR